MKRKVHIDAACSFAKTEVANLEIFYEVEMLGGGVDYQSIFFC